MARRPTRPWPRCEARWPHRLSRRFSVGREQAATRIAFFVVGFGMAAWAPLVPFAQARSGIGAGGLGLLLLCLGIGSIVTMSLSGALAARFGCRRVIVVSTVPLCASLPLLAVLAHPFALAAALLVFGAALGSLDVTMNIQAVIVERASGRAMMSGFHGLFSVGGIAGAACMTLALGAGASPLVATLGVVTVIVAATALAAPHLLAYGSRSDTPRFVLPRGIVLFIGALCFAAFMAEGAMLDWSAVFLTSMLGMTAAYAGLGYATFAATMTIGRLAGDRIVARFGGSTVVVAGGLCAAVGLALATLAASWPSALLGFALIGAGCANVVPVLYTRVGRQSVMPEHAAISAITTLGYAGILAGPALIGFVAQAASLSAAFLLLMLLQLGVAAGGRALRG
jgi:predicted MFS family arabinose efflux permease